MRKTALLILWLAVIGAAWFVVDRFVLPDEVGKAGPHTLYRARVVPPPEGTEQEPGTVLVCPAAGPHGGQVVRADWPAVETGGTPAGSSVFVEFPAGGEPVVRSVARDRWLLGLSAVLLALITLAAGRSAWRLLLVLFAAVGSLVLVLVPCLMTGMSPLVASLLTTSVFLGAGSVLIGRAGRVTLGILGGALGALASAVVLAALAVEWGRLTGVYSSLTKDLWYAPATRGLDFRQLLCAGIVVAACAIILDLAAAVATAIQQVDQAKPGQTRRQLAAAGLAVGRDVMGTELNTLIFAGVGANIGFLLLPMLGSAVPGFEIPALLVFSQQAVSAEILEMLVGTTALVLTIPITAGVTAALFARPERAPRPAWPHSARRLFLPGVAAAILLAAWASCDWVQARTYHRYAARPTSGSNANRYLVQGTVLYADSPIAAAGGEQLGERLQRVTCRLRSGPAAGETVELLNALSGFPGHDKVLHPGDSVLLNTWMEGGRVADATLLDFSRGRVLILFAFLLAGAVVAVGRKQGLRSLAALAVSGAVLCPAVWAAATAGSNGLFTFLAVLLPLSVLLFIILAGISSKALAGSIGTFGGVLLGGIVAASAASLLGLTGLASDSTMAVRMFTNSRDIDYVGLLNTGMVLGILGAGMDAAIAIASATEQVRRAKPDATRMELLGRGLAVGRAIAIPMVLALSFAYVGLNLPVLMLPQMLAQEHLSLLVSNERIASELLRILVGGIGVVTTVPLTALVAAVLPGWRRQNDGTNSLGVRPGAGS